MFVYINRNRLCQLHQYLLPVKVGASSRSTRQSIDFLNLSKDHIQYMRTHRTTELPPGMFLEHRMGTTSKTKDQIVQLIYVGFTLFRNFEQNICLLKDGTIVFCNRFLPGISSGNVGDDDEEQCDNGNPLIAGFKFGKVSLIEFEACHFVKTEACYFVRTTYFARTS